MGKGERGGQRKAIEAYESPIWDANTLAARNASNLMYGGDTSSGELYKQSRMGDPTAQPRTRAQPTNFKEGFRGTTLDQGRTSGGPDQYGFYEQPDAKGRLQGKDRAHEIYRWMVNTGASPEQALQKDLHGGDAAYLQQLIQQGGGQDSVAFQGWQPRPNNVPASARNVDGQWVVPGSGQVGGGTDFGTPGPGGVAGQTLGDYSNIASQFQNFADTGGYSPNDISNIRARAVSPIRSIYSGARRDVDRQRSLQGGYSPNRTASLAKMAREQSYATADASTNAEAAIAQMVNQGKRFGVGGMANLYGTSPGLASTFGNQALQAQSLQNQAAQGMLGARQGANQLPGAFDTTLNRIGRIGGAAAPFV